MLRLTNLTIVAVLVVQKMPTIIGRATVVALIADVSSKREERGAGGEKSNAACRSEFAKTNMAPEWFRNDPDLAVALALYHSVTTTATVTAAKRHRRLDGELTKISKELPHQH
ncbi:Importin subunit beta-1 [Hordeum vulgare]|nr:Importin subunit beta-1 [Hordeum vulgare]